MTSPVHKRTARALAALGVMTAWLVAGPPLVAQRTEAQDRAQVKGFGDGGFELGTPSLSWHEASTAFGSPICCIDTEEGPDLATCVPANDCGTGLGTAGPRSGDWWAWLGGFPGTEVASLEQTVTFPGGHPKTLQLWLWHGAAGDPRDTLRITLGDDELHRVNGESEPTAGYVSLEFDLVPPEGVASLPLRIECETFGPGVSNYSIDDLVIRNTVTPAQVDIPALNPLALTLLALGLALCGLYRLRS